jgi:prepilin signal peptidase PulO-like enzyme (type II secretory pathway)
MHWWYYVLVSLWVAAFIAWLVIAAIDFREYVVPNELNLILGVLGLAIAAILVAYSGKIFPFRDSFLEQYQLIFSPFQNAVLNRVLGMAGGGAFFGLLVFLSRGRGMGMGDVKLALVSGLVLGWPDIVIAALISFIIGGVAGGVLLALKQKTVKDKIPFAPFFVTGIFLSVLLGHSLVNGYFSLFNI